MEVLAQFTIFLTLIAIGFVILLLAIAGFYFIVRKIDNIHGVNPKLMKAVDILDWLEEDDDE